MNDSRINPYESLTGQSERESEILGKPPSASVLSPHVIIRHESLGNVSA